MKIRKMKMVQGRRLGIAILAVALAASLLLAACAPGPAGPAGEEKPVYIGFIAPLTGAPAAAVQVGYRNFVDILSYFEKEGIPGVTLPPGVTIKLLWGDSAFEVPKAISVYERMQESNPVTYYTMSPVEAEGLKSRFERDEVPDWCMSIDESMVYPPGWIFTIFPTESERFAVVCDWIMANWQEERPPRIVIMGTDSPSGHASEVMGTAYAKSIGIEMLPFETVPYLPLDTTAQLLRVRDEGADFVYFQTIWSTTIPIMKDAERLGLLDEMRFGGMENSQSVPLMEALGPAAEGYFSARSFPWYEEWPPIFGILRKVDGKLDTGGDCLGGFTCQTVLVKAISTAIDNVGYENLDGRAMKEAIYSIKDWDPYGIGRPYTYTPDDNRGKPLLRMYEVQGGDVVPVTDWRDAPMLVPEG
jgi:branched-chain amino acid transport system substrate-binding protein